MEVTYLENGDRVTINPFGVFVHRRTKGKYPKWTLVSSYLTTGEQYGKEAKRYILDQE